MTTGEGVIIVVDDDTSMSQAIERLLAAAGLRSRCFGSAEELLESGASSGAAVLILDIQLPGMSGLDLFRQLSSTGHVLPAIFITGQDRPNIREQAQKSGAVAYFTKPFEGRELIEVIHRHLPAA
ncbi:response regulator [Haloferula sp. BvORR071]|uniref:response regulator transcription factor n=1 Tax=Haloferula sp. BvORR071 TaxID=1396141 RepID=UPI000553ECDE|nr:response regulator [Haloferula sp. BvORR071]